MNSHHHEGPESEDEALRSIRHYWKEPSKYEFQAEIIETKHDWIRLNKSYFYPEGGGQQSDRGILKSGNQEYPVNDVQEKDKEIWINVPSHNYEVGIAVEGLIDGKRRELLSRNHSTQHIISAVFWDNLECDTTREEITIKESQVEIDTSLELKKIYQV